MKKFQETHIWLARRLERIVKWFIPKFEVRRVTDGWWIYKTLLGFSWKTKHTGPFGFNASWLNKGLAKSKISSMKNGNY